MLKELTAIRDIKDGPDEEWSHQARWDRTEAFEDLLLQGYPILGHCACGRPSKTLITIQKALEYCQMYNNSPDKEPQRLFLQEHFKVDDVTDDGLVQFLFYTLDGLNLTDHVYSLTYSHLTPEGEIFFELLNEFLEEKGDRF